MEMTRLKDSYASPKPRVLSLLPWTGLPSHKQRSYGIGKEGLWECLFLEVFHKGVKCKEDVLRACHLENAGFAILPLIERHRALNGPWTFGSGRF